MTPQKSRATKHVLSFLVVGAATIFTVPARSSPAPLSAGVEARTPQRGDRALDRALDTEAVHLTALDPSNDQSTASLLLNLPSISETSAFGAPRTSDGVNFRTQAGTTVTNELAGEPEQKSGDLSGMLAFYALFFGSENSSGSFSRSGPVNSLNSGNVESSPIRLGLGIFPPPLPLPPPPIVPPLPQPVPEPATLALFGIGLVGLGLSGLRRNKRKQQANQENEEKK